MGYLLEQRAHFAFMVICMVGVAVSLALLPVIIGNMTSILAAGPGPIEPLANEFIKFGVLVAFLATFYFLGSWTLAGMAQRALFRLRTSLFQS